MNDTGQYSITRTLHKGDTFISYKGIRERDGLPIIIKALHAGLIAPHGGERLRREYEIGRQLDSPRLMKPIGFQAHESQPMLIFADSGEEPLSFLTGAPMETARFLDIAGRVCAALADIHSQGFIHKDIKPENILVHPKSGEVKLTGFGIAQPLPRFPLTSSDSTSFEGSLPYMSPEQTGRMNRGIDHRSDLYSLGVTFYEMLTGILPFQAADPLEWVHCHIAREPKAPRDIVPGIAESISAIIMKLLAKEAEDRYQTASGVKADLEKCSEQWEAKREIEPFPLGQTDISDRLLIPQKLYGRERELRILITVFNRVVETGTPELVMVAGYSGIGKTSLVQELYKPVVRERGYFISGKFDQYKRDIPYSTVAEAFRELTRQLLTESEERVSGWKRRIREAVGENGQVIVDIIPQLELIIGKQAPAPELPPTKTQDRFNMVFLRFMRVFTRREHPLVIFFDDLQWVDPASLKLLQYSISHPDTRYLLLIGAYRDNEVSPSHPLMLAIDDLRRNESHFQSITLSPLSIGDLKHLIADTFRCDEARVEPLTELVCEKTGCNPFFVIQLLSTLHQEGLLSFDIRQRAWTWDMVGIRAKNYTDNVAELMIDKLRRLPAATQPPLEAAACLGDMFELRTLAVVDERSPTEMKDRLGAAVQEGLLLCLNGIYKFLHDRVREAVYTLIPEEQRAALHLRIGRVLVASLSAEEVQAKVFDLASHFNHGAVLITEQEERVRVAELNLTAARKAKASTAYRAAAGYLAAGVGLLGSMPWERHYDLVFASYLELAESELLSGAFDEAERHLPVLLSRARTPVEKAAVYRIKIDTHNIKGEGGAAIDDALDCLRILGIDMPAHPSDSDVQKAYEAVWSTLGARGVEELIGLPLMTDPEMQAAMEILSRLYIPSYYSDNNLFYLHICHGVNLSLRHGNSAASTYAYGWFGVLLAATFHRPRDGQRFARLAYDLMERHRFVAYKAPVNIALKFVAYWSQTLDEMIGYSRAMLDAGLEAGDMAAACFSWSETLLGMITRGDRLPEVHDEAERGLDFVRKAGFRDVYDLITGLDRFVLAMRGLTRSLSTFDDDHFSELEFEARLDPARMPTLVFYHHAVKLMARFLAGDLDAALASGNTSKDLLWAGLFSAQSYYFYFYYALTLAAAFHRLSAGEQKDALDVLALHEAQLGEWARNSPQTFHNAHSLVRAEITRITGKDLESMHLYEQAIKSARENGFIQNEALANELAANFYLDRGFETIAHAYLRQARACYLRWGADGKVRQLDGHYPRLQEEVRPAGALIGHVDAITVVNASQAISGEIDLFSLLETLMRIVLENAGAQKGYLLLAQDHDLSIKAQAWVEGEIIKTRLNPVIRLDRVLPESIINYARRTRETVMLEEASERNIFSSDPYILRNKPVSVLCLPVLRQANLVGLLYLENNVVKGAFTAGRIAVLEMLSAQAAISLSNTQLYQGLQQEIAERKGAEQRLLTLMEELSRSNKELEQFAYVASHDLQEPLRMVARYVELLGRRYQGRLDADADKYISFAVEGAKRMYELIKDLLTFYQIGTGTREIRPVAMESVITQALYDLGGTIEETRTQVTRDDMPVVMGEMARLTQLMQHLVSNAVKFRKKNIRPLIHISVSRLNNEWQFGVHDNGIGIEQQYCDRIFIMFQRLQTRSEYPGTGMGLAICRKIIEWHGGRIWVESKPGEGSSFFFTLPVKGEEPHVE